DDRDIAEVERAQALPHLARRVGDRAVVEAERRHDVHGVPRGVERLGDGPQVVPGLIHARQDHDRMLAAAGELLGHRPVARGTGTEAQRVREVAGDRGGRAREGTLRLPGHAHLRASGYARPPTPCRRMAFATASGAVYITTCGPGTSTSAPAARSASNRAHGLDTIGSRVPRTTSVGMSTPAMRSPRASSSTSGSCRIVYGGPARNT